MRTTIEMPDELLARAKSRAALERVSLKQFFIAAVEQKLEPPVKKGRREFPVIGNPNGPKMPDLTRQQIEEAAIPIEHFLPGRR